MFYKEARGAAQRARSARSRARWLKAHTKLLKLTGRFAPKPLPPSTYSSYDYKRGGLYTGD